MVIKAVIFDCFGVLIMPGPDSLKHDFPELAPKLQELTLQADYNYINRSEYNHAIAELTGIALDEIEPHYWAKNVRNESAFEWVKKLKKEGVYKVGLLSNIGKGWLDDFLPEAERRELFDSEVLSGVVGIVKPDARIFEVMANQLGLETDECVMIDDILENIEGASRAGMPGVLYATTSQAKQDLDRIITEHA